MDEFRYRINAPHVTRADGFRLFETYADFARELVQRPLALMEETAWSLVMGAARGALGPWSASVALDAGLAQLRDLALGLATAPAAAAMTAATRLSAPQEEFFGDRPDPLGADVPVTRGYAQPLFFAAAAKRQAEFAAAAGFDPASPDLALPPLTYGAPFILPARVQDASHAWASWFVPLAQAEALLNMAVETKHVPDLARRSYRPFVTRDGRAMVTLWATDHRIGDCGPHRELTLALTVLPVAPAAAGSSHGVAKGDAAPQRALLNDPGQLILRMIVSDVFPLAPAAQVWGLPAEYFGPSAEERGLSAPERADRALTFDYEPDHVTLRVGRHGLPSGIPPMALELAFPRFGAVESMRIPLTIYSTLPTVDGSGRPVRTTMSVSASGQGLQFGGPVAIRLPRPGLRGRDGVCLCAAGMTCLCDTLETLELHRHPPAANGWAEHHAALIERPCDLHARVGAA
ncbi:MAG: hypothetical protein K2X74_19970 [Acetobacteraceae bacterium]|nr:hypothetical protein [Acetobacteraceae bacterium]